MSKEKDLEKQIEHAYAELESNSKSRLEREYMRRNMADPSFLNKMEAIDRQNSLVKNKGSKQRGMDDPFRNQMSKESVESRGKNFPGFLGDLNGGRRNPDPLISDSNQAVNSQKDMRRSAGVGGSNLGTFDQEAYLQAQRMREGEGDKMKRFQFNQVASDATAPNRFLRDYRNQA